MRILGEPSQLCRLPDQYANGSRFIEGGLNENAVGK